MKQCIYFSHSYSRCGHNHDIGVTCPPGKLSNNNTVWAVKFVVISLTANCDDGDVRLLLGSNETNGYVMVCHKNRWGPMCYHYRDYSEATMNNAKTVCSQLGYIGGK